MSQKEEWLPGAVCLCVRVCAHMCVLTIEEFPFGENDEYVLKWLCCLQNSVQILQTIE